MRCDFDVVPRDVSFAMLGVLFPEIPAKHFAWRFQAFGPRVLRHTGPLAPIARAWQGPKERPHVLVYPSYLVQYLPAPNAAEST